MSRFGRGLRGRKKAAGADEEVTQIADEANLWWTRRDFVQHAVIRTRRSSTADATAPSGGPTATGHDAPAWGAPPPTNEHGPAGAGHSSDRSSRSSAPPSTPPHRHERAGADPLAGRSFAEVFTTESLFAEPAAERTGRSAAATAAVRASAPPKVAAPHVAAEPPRPRRRPLAANHPLTSALEHLGLGREAGWSDIQFAYRTKAKAAHPDLTGDDGEAMALLNAAYNALRDGRSYGLFDEA